MTKTLVSYCTNRIAPAAAAVVLALTGGSALASTNGQAAIDAKLTATYIPTLKTTVDYTVQSVKSTDLLLAITLAIKDNPALTPAEIAGIAEGALEPVGVKYRADKDKIAGQILATVLAARPGLTDQEIANVAAAVFKVNSANPNIKARLTATGQAATLAAAIKSSPNDNASNLIGQGLFTASPGDLAIQTLLSNTATALGGTTTNATAANALANVVDGIFDANLVAAASREGLIKLAAQKAALKNVTAAGALFGGLVKNNPNGNYTSQAQLSGLATLIVTDPKLAKAWGEALANVAVGITDKAGLIASFDANVAIKATAFPLIAQGLLRAGATADVVGIIDASNTAAPIVDKAKFAAVAMVGTGNDLGKVSAITTKLATGLDTIKKTALGAAAIGAVGAATPQAAESVTEALLASGGFGDDTARVKFGTDNVAKLKSYAAAGYMAKAIAEASNTQTQTNVAVIAAQLMKKGVKAAPDIANQISTITSAGTSVTFAQAIVNATILDSRGRPVALGKALIQPTAVGVSIADRDNAGDITAAVITHDVALDKAALAKAAVVGGAVAKAVDEEAASDIGRALSEKMSFNGLGSGRPIKSSLVTALATSLAKEVQAKPGVRLSNRMDELGEIAAVLTKGVLAQATGKAQATLIAGIGSAILKSLSKTPTLSGNPNLSQQAGLVAANSTLKADLWEARDIAGSIAQVIQASGLTPTEKQALLGTDSVNKLNYGPLLTAFLKLSGKVGSSTYQAVLDAFATVRAGNGGGIFEDGVQADLYDPETDKRNG